MIKPQELRIGNWVYYKKYTKKVYSVDLLGIELPFLSDISDVDDIRSVNSEEIDPIPLTEEWAVKFNFFEWTGWYYLTLKSLGDFFTLCYAPNEDLLMLNIGERTITYENPKVHQLQNLVFALEGVELEMKV